MKVIVLAVKELSGVDEYEIELRVGETEYCGKLKRDGKLPIWNPDAVLSQCLSNLPLAPKRVNQVIVDYRLGKEIQFPVDLGDF